MAKIWIEPSKAKNLLSLVRTLEQTLDSMSQDVDGVRNGLRYTIAAQAQIAARLREAAEQLERESAATGALHAGLEQVISRYEYTENRNRERAVPPSSSVQGEGNTSPLSFGGMVSDTIIKPNQPIWDQFPSITIPPTLWPFLDTLLPTPAGPISPFIPGVLDILSPSASEDTAQDENSPWFVKNDASMDIAEKDWKDDLFPRKVYYKDPETGEITTVDPNDKEAMEEFKKNNKNAVPVDLTLASVGVKGETAFWGEASISGQTDWGGHEGSISFGKLEGNAAAFIGWGGIGASIGGSFSALSAKERGYLGTEDANVYGEVSVDVGKIGANAGAGAGLLDADGNFDPKLYAGASAELIGGEISGKVGGEIAGVDVGVEGSLNYGIGAHANVGYNDGKFSFDIGASIGVGASVKLEIDVSGAVDAVTEAASDMWSGVADLFGW